MSELNYLTRAQYEKLVQKLEGGHWSQDTIETRWDYHHRVIELIKALNIGSAADVLEMGTMGISCVSGSNTIDYAERWNFPGKNPTYLHDARQFPWPIADKQYELFIALRVYQHLIPVQKEAFREALRIAKKVIIVVPDLYINEVLPASRGITYRDFCDFNNGVHPNLYLPTAQGMLYYWDTEKPSMLNIENVMAKANIAVVQYQWVEKENLNLRAFLRRYLKTKLRIS
jgi:hypothetical protein